MCTEAAGEPEDPTEAVYFIASLPKHFVDRQIAMGLIEAARGEQRRALKSVLQQAAITDHRLGVDASDSKAATIDQVPAKRLTPVPILDVGLFRHFDSSGHGFANLKRRSRRSGYGRHAVRQTSRPSLPFLSAGRVFELRSAQHSLGQAPYIRR